MWKYVPIGLLFVFTVSLVIAGAMIGAVYAAGALALAALVDAILLTLE